MMAGFQWCQPRLEAFVGDGTFVIGCGDTLDDLRESEEWIETDSPVEVRE